MGDRGNVRISMRGGEIYLYTHWYGSQLPRIVRDALIRGRGRWNDDSYLARVIFSEMIQGDVQGTTGFGISPEPDDGDVIVKIWPKSQQIQVKGKKRVTFQYFVFGENEPTELRPEFRVWNGYGLRDEKLVDAPDLSNAVREALDVSSGHEAPQIAIVQKIEKER